MVQEEGEEGKREIRYRRGGGKRRRKRRKRCGGDRKEGGKRCEGEGRVGRVAAGGREKDVGRRLWSEREAAGEGRREEEDREGKDEERSRGKP